MAIDFLPQAARTDAVTEARIHLAAAYRLAVLHELDEGIDNFHDDGPGSEGPVPRPAFRLALVRGLR